MTCQSLISDLSGVESPSVATARMHLLRRFSRDGPEKLAPHAGGPGLRVYVGCASTCRLALRCGIRWAWPTMAMPLRRR